MNYGEAEQVIVEDKHEQLVSKEDFKRVRQIMDIHSKPIKVGEDRQMNLKNRFKEGCEVKKS